MSWWRPPLALAAGDLGVAEIGRLPVLGFIAAEWADFGRARVGEGGITLLWVRIWVTGSGAGIRTELNGGSEI